MQKIKYIVGVDEAGRGPLAGPVAIGVVCVPSHFDWNLIPGVNDSKKVSTKNREAIFRRTQQLKKQGVLKSVVTLVSSSVIDTKGISFAVRHGISACFKKLDLDPQITDVRLDGLLKAPPEYVHQQTITKGDQKEKVIGLASIMAKVTRDAHMVKLAKRYPEYHFEIHKGYGTKMHRNIIELQGLSLVHRKTFTKNFSRK